MRVIHNFLLPAQQLKGKWKLPCLPSHLSSCFETLLYLKTPCHCWHLWSIFFRNHGHCIRSTRVDRHVLQAPLKLQPLGESSLNAHYYTAAQHIIPALEPPYVNGMTLKTYIGVLIRFSHYKLSEKRLFWYIIFMTMFTSGLILWVDQLILHWFQNKSTEHLAG